MSSHSLSKQKHRLSILFSLSIFLVVVVLDVGFLSFKYFNYERQELARLSFQSQTIAKVLADNPDLEQDILHGKGFSIPTNGIWRGGMMINPMGLRPGMRRNVQTENFFFYDANRREILFSPKKDDEFYGSILEEIRSNKQEWQGSFSLGDSEYLFQDTPITSELSAVFFTESRMTSESILIDILIYLIGAILLSLGVYFISRRFVDNTLAPVEKNMDDMEQFVHNAGHELKTPIAVIKSSLELMRLKKNYAEGITESIDELDRMDDLIQALISLSSLDNPESSESVDVSETFEKLQKHYQKKLEEKNISLQIITKKPLQIKAKREYVEILFGNLLSNAIKYNKTWGEIIITIQEKSVEIRDTGIGIAEENIGKIFDRFYQEWEAREVSSFGIGLSLAKKIVDMYKWTLIVTSEKGIGTTIKIEF